MRMRETHAEPEPTPVPDLVPEPAPDAGLPTSVRGPSGDPDAGSDPE